MIYIFVSLMGITFASADALAGSKPNILFVLQDDLGWNDIAYHNKKAKPFTQSFNTDDMDLRWTWISTKLASAGYTNYWYGKGHTGYLSANHLPSAHNFSDHYGYLSGM